MSDIITITVADLALLPAWERGQVLTAVGYVWDARAKNLRLDPFGKLTPLLEPGTTPEPVEAPREVPEAPAGAPGVDRPADYSANISESAQASVHADASDVAASIDVPESEAEQASESDVDDSPAHDYIQKTMTAEEEERWAEAMKAGVTITDNGPSPVTDYPCDLCDESFPTPQKRGAHKRYNHAGTPRQGAKPRDNWTHKCGTCGESFPGPRMLESHERRCVSSADVVDVRAFKKPDPIVAPSRDPEEHAHRYSLGMPQGLVIVGICGCGRRQIVPSDPSTLSAEGRGEGPKCHKHQIPSYIDPNGGHWCNACQAPIPAPEAVAS